MAIDYDLLNMILNGDQLANDDPSQIINRIDPRTMYLGDSQYSSSPYTARRSAFDEMRPEQQGQYLLNQTRQLGNVSNAPISRTDANVPFDVGTLDLQNQAPINTQQANVSNNVNYQPPYQPIPKDNSPDLQPSLITKLFDPKLAAKFPNQPIAPQSQQNTSGQNMAQDNSSSFMRNILGTVPSYYGGLLGAEEAKSLQSRANTQGLLGATIGLLGGMGTRGTTAAQNIAGALSGGLQASQGAIQQCITNYGQQQQLMLQQRQQAGIAAMKIKYPDLADEFDTNPAGAFRIISEREAISRKPTVVSQGGALVTPTGEVLYAGTSPGKETKPESFTGEYGNLALRMFGTADVAKLDEQQRIALGKEAERLGTNKGINVTTNVNASDKKFGENFGAATAAAVESTFNKAQSAVNTLSTIATIKPLIQSSVFAGPLSASEATISRLGEKFGITSGTTQEKLNRTTQAMQGLAQLELQAAGEMRGQGAITDFERSLIARAAGGDLAVLTQKEVLGLLGALEKVSQKKIATHKTNLERLRKRPDTSGLADFYELETSQPRLQYDPISGTLIEKVK